MRHPRPAPASCSDPARPVPWRASSYRARRHETPLSALLPDRPLVLSHWLPWPMAQRQLPPGLGKGRQRGGRTSWLTSSMADSAELPIKPIHLAESCNLPRPPCRISLGRTPKVRKDSPPRRTGGCDAVWLALVDFRYGPLC